MAPSRDAGIIPMSLNVRFWKSPDSNMFFIPDDSSFIMAIPETTSRGLIPTRLKPVQKSLSIIYIGYRTK